MTKKQNRITLTVAIALTAFGFMNLGTTAWFTQKRQTSHPVMIDSPQTVFIRAGNNEGIMYLDISDIDVEKSYDEDGNEIKFTPQKNFVFCIDGSDFSTYDIQLAHTNNIPFKYSIYRAEEIPSNQSTQADAVYYSIKEDCKFYYKKKGDALELINKNIDKGQTYDDGDFVQDLAIPTYLEVSDIDAELLQNTSGEQINHFTDFFILEVSWEDALKEDSNFGNNKETDIVCITVDGRTKWNSGNSN